MLWVDVLCISKGVSVSQSRRSVSLSGELYNALKKLATEGSCGVSSIAELRLRASLGLAPRKEPLPEGSKPKRSHSKRKPVAEAPALAAEPPVEAVEAAAPAVEEIYEKRTTRRPPPPHNFGLPTKKEPPAPPRGAGNVWVV